MLAMVRPAWFANVDLNIPSRAGLGTQATGGTGILSHKLGVKGWNEEGRSPRWQGLLAANPPKAV